MSNTKQQRHNEAIDESTGTKRPTNSPRPLPLTFAGQATLEKAVPKLITLVTAVHIESLREGGPEDPIAAALYEDDERLMASKEWIACHWYVGGIADALGLARSQVLSVVQDAMPTSYPDRIVRYINATRFRRGISRLPTPLMLGHRGA